MELNHVGDVVVATAEEFRAIAHPERLALLDRVRRGEPLESRDLPHLEDLERAGFVRREGDGWSPVGKGIYFEIPDEHDAQEPARRLTRLMLLAEAERPGRWAEHDEPRLTVQWARAAGMFNARVELTADELRAVQEELERVLAPYTTRGEAPAGAAPVRVLAYFLPEPNELGAEQRRRP